VRQLRFREPVSAPQTTGGGEGVVSLKARVKAGSGKGASYPGEFRSLYRSEIPAAFKIHGCSELP